MQKVHTTSGYSLVEVLVAITILLIAIAGPMTIASQGIKSSRFASEQTTAFFLAQEGIESVMSLRDSVGLKYYNGTEGYEDSRQWAFDLCGSTFNIGDSCTFGLDFTSDDVLASFVDCGTGNEDNCKLYKDTSSGRAVYNHDSSGEETEFSRRITLTALDSYVVRLTSEIIWSSTVFNGNSQTISLSTNVYDLYGSQLAPLPL